VGGLVLVAGLVATFGPGLVGGLLVPASVLVLALALTVSIGFGINGTRYVAFLLCTRGRFTTDPLPWRLGRFLNWCYQAGLIRQAGISYQFRHRELQQYLVRSQPLPASPTAH
jgi:hypothetical protein